MYNKSKLSFICGNKFFYLRRDRSLSRFSSSSRPAIGRFWAENHLTVLSALNRGSWCQFGVNNTNSRIHLGYLRQFIALSKNLVKYCETDIKLFWTFLNIVHTLANLSWLLKICLNLPELEGDLASFCWLEDWPCYQLRRRSVRWFPHLLFIFHILLLENQTMYSNKYMGQTLVCIYDRGEKANRPWLSRSWVVDVAEPCYPSDLPRAWPRRGNPSVKVILSSLSRT